MRKALIREVMAAMGRKGGRIGGRARMDGMTEEERIELARAGGKSRLHKLTPEQRSAIAQKAALASARVRGAKAAAKRKAAKKLAARPKP